MVFRPRLRSDWISTACVLAVSGLPFGSAAVNAQQSQQPVQIFEIDLPSQPLAQSLAALSRQTGTAITVGDGATGSAPAPAVRGRFTVREAIERIFGPSVAVSASGAGFVVRRQTGLAGAVPLPEVRVEAAATRKSPVGPDIGYRAERSFTATRTDTPILETPQAISVITRELMEDRNARTLGEALDMVAGITRRENYYFADDPFLRGFFLDPSTAFYRDGIRYFNSTSIDTDLLERVEVLKGPASVLYGGLEPGGLVNLVSKRPLAEPFVYAKQEIGRWNDYRTTLDISQPFSGGGGIRVPITYRNYDSFRDVVDGRSFQIAPVVEWVLSGRTRVSLLGFYTDQRRTNDNIKIPVLDGAPVGIPIERFLGQPEALDEARFGSATAAIEHVISNALTYRGALNYYNSREAADRVISFFGFEPDNRTLTRFGGDGNQNFDAWGTQHDLRGSAAWGGMRHRWLIGFDLFRQDEERPTLFGTYPSIDIFEPVYDGTFSPFTSRRAEGSVKDRRYGIYAQDQITLVENQAGVHKLELLLGVRADRSEQSYDIENAFTLEASSGSDTESAVSPRVGLLWMPAPSWSLYASYSRSFNPQFAVTQDQSLAEPQEGRQFEIGTKVDLRRNLSATVSLFDLRKTNVPNASPLGPDFPTQLSGEETSRGVEIELRGELAPGWQLSVAYTHLDPFVSESNNGDEGNQLAGAARNTFNAWLSYTAPFGLGGGIGASSVSRVFATSQGTLSVDGYALADAAVWFRPNASLGKGWSLAATVKNVFDRKYFLTANGFQTSLSPGTPRNFVVSAAYGF